MLTNLLTQTETGTTTSASFFICFAAAIVMGLLIAVMHTYKNETYSKNFIITLVMMPAVVQVILILVNGNLGTGVAVMGAFGLVRFRSIPGNSREIGSIFLAMAAGLAAGTGYIFMGFAIILILGLLVILLNQTSFGTKKQVAKHLKVTIPENLDYTDIFDDIFERYTTKATFLKVRTVNMGSMYELQYQIVLKDLKEEKKMLDEIRCRNGNLTIVCGWLASEREEL